MTADLLAPDNSTSFLAELCKDSFAEFVREFWDEVPGAQPLQWNWHMEVLCRELEELAFRVRGGLPKTHDTIINISPGTSKSTLCSILFPVWAWTSFPQARVLSASHTSDLVLDLANKARCVVKGEKYQAWYPHVAIRKDQDTKGYYANTAGGDRYTCTVAGKSPMGFHAHFLIVDDPIDPKKTASEVELKTAKDFFDNVLPSRKVDKQVSVTVLIMQRLHVDDPTGHLLEKSKREGAVPIRHFCLPAEVPDAQTRSVVSPPELLTCYGEDGLMDPVRLPRSVLRERQTDGAFAYAGQYLQQPFPPGGGMFKRNYFNQRVRAAPYDCRRVIYWDRAFCLVPGTLVETEAGPKPIELVVAGDRVLTRSGYKEVEWAGVSGYVDSITSVLFANGSVLSGTPDHRVWTENRYWVDLVKLNENDYNVAIADLREMAEQWQTNGTLPWSQLSSKAFDTLANGGLSTSRRGGGTKSGSGITTTRITGPCGGVFTETSPLAVISTTKTKTLTTTQLITLSASLPSNTLLDILKRLDTGVLWPTANTFVKSSKPASGGGRITPIKSVQAYGLCGRSGSTENLCAVGVMRGTHREPSGPLYSARKAVGRSTSTGPEKVPVYDLTVRDVHEFFANGILVHNSANDDSCQTCGTLVGYHEETGNWYVGPVRVGRWFPEERDQEIVGFAKQSVARYGPKHAPAVVVEQEPAAGADSYRHLAKRLVGFTVHADPARTNKEQRADPWASQCAAGNVILVDDGTWDIEEWVKEHCAFPNGKYKDRVDSAGGGFNWLAKRKRSGPTLRVLPARDPNKKHALRLVVCSHDALAATLIEDRCLLVNLCDFGGEVMWNAGRAHPSLDVTSGPEGMVTVGDPSTAGYTADETPPGPVHGLNKLLDSLTLAFDDLNPAQCQEEWTEELARRKFQPEQGKVLWRFLTKKRDSQPQCLVFASPEGKRAASTAYAVCDVLRLPRSVIYRADDPECKCEGPPENSFIYDQVKAARSMVL